MDLSSYSAFASEIEALDRLPDPAADAPKVSDAIVRKRERERDRQDGVQCSGVGVLCVLCVNAALCLVAA